MDQHSRAAKHTGDFGEGLATYTLIRQGFEVAVVDHVGADLIAQKDEHRLAISVKTRQYRAGSTEHRSCVVEKKEIIKLEHFAQRFALEPVCIHIACVEDEGIIHLLMMRATDIKTKFCKGKNAYTLSYHGPEQLKALSNFSYVDYSRWSGETISNKLFGPSRCYDDDAYGED